MAVSVSSRQGVPRPARDDHAGTFAIGMGPRVLLCEDSAAARTLTATLLERLGFIVDVACHGEEAVERARAGRYDVILMDLDMPVLDGEAAARRIRTLDGAAGAVPIVALSGYAVDAVATSPLSDVFDAALAKPLSGRDLENALRGVLEITAAEPDGSATGPVLDGERLALVLANLPHPQRPALIALAADEIARLADELDAVGQPADPRNLRRIAHQICGTAANFAAVALSRLAAAVESGCRQGVPDNIDRQVAALAACARATVGALKSQCRPKEPS